MNSPFPHDICLFVCVRVILGATAHQGAVFSAVSEDGTSVRIVADHKALPRIPRRGETWRIEGEYRQHPLHGRQFIARRCTYHVPKGRILVHYLSNSPEFEGIGDAYAKRLYSTFGDELVEILNRGDGFALERVLSKVRAKKLVEAWAEKCTEVALIAFLDHSGFDISLAQKLRRVWGERAIEMLELNPYFMLAFASWQQVDSVARKIGIAEDDRRRLIGGVESFLYERLDDGHTFTSSSVLAKGLTKRLGVRCVGRAIEFARLEGAVVDCGVDGFQPISVAMLERDIDVRIQHLLGRENSILNEHNEAKLAVRIRQLENQQGISLNTEQLRAVWMTFNKPISLITGGAGVGKTTVLRVIVELAKSLSIKPLQMALTGKAAKRISDVTGETAFTIARFFVSVKAGEILIEENSLFIVDESSMLDLPTMYKIFRYLPSNARIVFVGDPAQLPPVGFGLVFHKLVNYHVIPNTHLLQVHRQTWSSGIPTVATHVRNRIVPQLSTFLGTGTGVSFVDCSRSKITATLLEIASPRLRNGWQILSPVNDGPGGIKEINESFHFHNMREEPLGGFKYASGDPVIHLINDYDRGLMNGTLGRIVHVSHGWTSGLTIHFEEGEYFFPSHELPGRIALAYAISVHKAQGAQFKRVAIAIKPSRVLDNSLVYTALTRGIEQVVFVGDKAAFEHAVLGGTTASKREVGFLRMPSLDKGNNRL